MYDLDADPYEMRNLIVSPLLPEKNLAQAKKMKSKLVKWLKIYEPHKAASLENLPLK